MKVIQKKGLSFQSEHTPLWKLFEVSGCAVWLMVCP